MLQHCETKRSAQLLLLNGYGGACVSATELEILLNFEYDFALWDNGKSDSRVLGGQIDGFWIWVDFSCTFGHGRLDETSGFAQRSKFELFLRVSNLSQNQQKLSKFIFLPNLEPCTEVEVWLIWADLGCLGSFGLSGFGLQAGALRRRPLRGVFFLDCYWLFVDFLKGFRDFSKKLHFGAPKTVFGAPFGLPLQYRARDLVKKWILTIFADFGSNLKPSKTAQTWIFGQNH